MHANRSAERGVASFVRYRLPAALPPAAILLALHTVLPCRVVMGLQAPVVRGVVRAAADSTPLGDAIVRPASGGAGTTTSPTGRFTLRLSADTARIVAVRIGFAPETLTVSGLRQPVSIYLRAAPISLDPIAIAADRGLSAASSRVVRDLDLQLRPLQSAQELLRLVPGLVLAQHAGGGKAEQAFLRGFDADHGTDLAVSVDGVPVNMVSHAHGQGYADLHFLIPEVVERADLRKGPYDLRDGDLATAGAVEFTTRDRVGAGVVTLRGGSFGTVAGTALLPLGGDASEPGGYMALAGRYSDGPFDRPQRYHRVNGFAKWTTPIHPEVQLVASASAFDSRWDASGQVPERAVRAGLISRFGSLDPSEGGATHRYDVRVALRRVGSGHDWDAMAFLTAYRLQLFSNFTFFARDSVNGDGIEQLDDRILAGGRLQAVFPWSPSATLRIGTSFRTDAARVQLLDQVRRTRRGVRVDSDIDQQHAGLWVGQEASLTPRLRVELGLRGDLFRFAVDDHLMGQAGEHRSGTRWEGVVSPKLNAAYRVGDGTTLYLNAGFGFHSNDARDVILAPAGEPVLPRALGTELGARHTWAGGSVGLVAWRLDLERELVYVGDEGVTEPSGRTRRLGLDLEARLRVTEWLWADADLALARSRFRDAAAGAHRVPLAPERVLSGGVTARPNDRAHGGIRVRHVAARPADETNAVRARGHTIVELFGQWALGPVEVLVGVDNLFNTEWNEAQFAATSRLRFEPAPVTELHLTPGAPRSVQLGLGYRW